jgi:DNA repair/transcription protein MET18/MMS19
MRLCLTAYSEIESGASKLLNIVLSLRPFIDGDNLIQEAKAIEYLSTVLALLDPSTLVRQDVSLMCRYFEARIEVGHNAGLKESAVGLRVLASMKHFDSKEAKEIAEKIFSIIDSFNEYPVSLRIEIYKLLHLLMEQYRHVLKLDSETFIPGLLALADLEKDPRNLMLYFSMLLVVLAEWDTDSHKERLWEAVSKYFPITFRPRPNDPIGITADDLKSRLRSCIAATSAFAPWSFSFLIEKLDHQVTANVKKDVMQTMAACVENYSPKAVSTWASQVWDALKYEVLSATDDELAGEALKVLKAIATRLSVPGVTLERPENAGVLRYTEMICKESIKHLQDRKQLKATGQILGRVAAGSPSSFESIVQNIFPRLITIVQDTDSFLQRKDLLEVFNEVLDALFELMQEQGIRHGADPIGYGGLVLFVDSLFQIYSMNLTGVPVAESALRTSAVRGFLNVARLPSFLQPNEVGMIIQNLNDVIMETGNAALRDAALSSLQEIAGEYPQQIGDITFPKLLAALPAVLQPHVDVVTVAPHLQALAFISMGSHLFAIFVRRLSNKLEDIFRASQDSESANSYGCAILGSIFYCIQERELKHEAKTKEGEQEMKTVRSRDLEQYQSLLKYLCTFCFSKTSFVDGSGQQRYYVGLKTYGSDNHKSTSETFIHRAGRICTLLVRSLDINDQQQTVSEIFTLFVDVPRPQAAGAVLENVVQAHSQLANKPVGDAATVLLSLIMSYSILAGLRKEVSLHHRSLLCHLLNWIRQLWTSTLSPFADKSFITSTKFKTFQKPHMGHCQY